jgi:hypothetical protein
MAGPRPGINCSTRMIEYTGCIYGDFRMFFLDVQLNQNVIKQVLTLLVDFVGLTLRVACMNVK